MDDTYEYGMDAPMRYARTITVESEREADAVFAHAQELPGLPTGYIVRANLACNQVDSFRMNVCDWKQRLEVRRERVQALSRARLGVHLRIAHPYLSKGQTTRLLHAIQFNFRDVGR